MERCNILVADIYKYIICSHRYKYCKRACDYCYHVCLRLSRGQDIEGSIQDVLAAPDQPVEFEEEGENGDLLYVHTRVSRLIYHVCTHFSRRCQVVCYFHYRLCLRGSVVAQVIEENIDK